MDKKEQARAIVTINCAGDMTQDERERLADWLSLTAEGLIEDGWNYATRFRARYFEV